MITISVNSAELTTALDNLARSAADPSPAMNEIGAAFVARIIDGFSDSKDPWGASWAPLKHRVGEPLRDTGKLMNSINFSADAQGVSVGTGDHEGKVLKHQFGGVNTGRMFRGAVVPARPFMPIRGNQADLPSDWTDEALEIIANHLQAALP